MKKHEKANIKFFNNIARYYDSFPLAWLLNKINKKTLAYVHIKNKARILDASCGTGNLLIMLSKYNVKLYGVDISKEMLKIAKRKLGNRAELKLMSVENLKFKSNYFDYVFSTEAFHHYYNQEMAMKNFYRILKKDGMLAITDINFGFILNKIFEKIEPGNNRILRADEFKRIFKENKFGNIKQEKMGLFETMTQGEKWQNSK